MTTARALRTLLVTIVWTPIVWTPIVWTASVWTASGCSRVTPRSQAHFDLGVKARQLGAYAEAVKDFDGAINFAGKNFYTEAYLERGECLLTSAVNPPPGHTNGFPEDRTATLRRAIDDFQLVATQEEVSSLDRARALDGRGESYLELKEPERAARAFEEILAIEPETVAEPGTELSPYHLNARSQLGWIYLERAIAGQTAAETTNTPNSDPNGEEPAMSPDLLRQAHAHFSKGLGIKADDLECNLGKGICLHYRERHRDALEFLEPLLRHNGHVGNDPRLFFYLARATEEWRGLSHEALKFYLDALRHDSDRNFLPLYSHLVSVLPRYFPTMDDTTIRIYVQSLLEYSGDNPSYWTQLAGVTRGLTETTRVVENSEAARQALAFALTRSGDIDAAVETVLELQERSDFPDIVNQVFPHEQEKFSAYAFGRAKVLFAIGWYKQLEQWFSEERGSKLESQIASDDFARRALVIRAKTLVRLWVEQGVPSPEIPLAASRDDTLLTRARVIFEKCLQVVTEDVEARLGLAETFEHLGLFNDALANYRNLATTNPTEAEGFRRIRKLHETAGTLSEKERAEAWNLLRSYSGANPDLLTYVEERRRDISTRVALYCKSCGRRRTSATESFCFECGRRLPVKVD